MNNYELICHKLEGFIKKYYTNELIKGSILFFAIGLLYFLMTVSFEFFFWFGKVGRSILFWLFVLVEVSLFIRFIAYPIAKLFKISKGIDYYQASKIIGNHFPEVNDKLLNVLQLKENQGKVDSELVLASIDQKALELKPIPFQIAINFKKNLSYAKYAIIPVLIIAAIYISGNSSLFSDSYERVVHYQEAYEPPAPFHFYILNDSLRAKENDEFTLQVHTKGKVIPEDASIHYNGETYFLKPVSPGVFEYRFNRLEESLQFYLSANQVASQPYTIAVTNVPTVLSFEMNMQYPAYVHKKNEIIKGTGNATIPEGTYIHWELTTRNTNSIHFSEKDTANLFQQKGERFNFDKQIFNTTYYQISTSNKHLKNYEQLGYNLKVVKDAYPEMHVEMKKDTISEDMLYFFGRVSDDYGLEKLQLVYYPADNEEQLAKRRISISKGNFDEFVYAFPDTLSLIPGKAYDFYFQVFDNDGVNGSKSTKSQTFSYKKLTKSEETDKQLNNQEKAIQGMNNSLKNMKDQNEELKELDQLQKEKNQLNYNDRKKLQTFVERQKEQEQLMKQYSKKMKENLEKFQPEQKNDEYKKELQERLERNEKKLKENEKLLEELEKYKDKIDKEELNEQLEKLAKHNQNEQRNLEQLVELTKRYYVQKKAEKIASDLNELAKKQEDLSTKDKANTVAKQDSLNKAFEKIKDAIKKLSDENKGLKKPMELGFDKKKEEGVTQDQEQAKEELEKSTQNNKENQEGKKDKQDPSEEKPESEKDSSGEKQQDNQEKNKQEPSKSKSAAQQKQKSAAQKMKQMSQQMQMQMMQGGSQQQMEDAKMLRQILDNLVTFSFQQEDLMQDFKAIKQENPDFPNKLRYQNVLRENFKHIDDSLYALALRNPMISEQVTEKLTDVEFNLEKALERLSQNEIQTGVASQQYVFKDANDLANMLGNSLSQMQNQLSMGGGGSGQGMPSPGEGGGQQGRGFQLSDIIKKQGDLNEDMQQGAKQGGKKPGEQQGSQGESGKQGQGQQGQEGQKGENNGQSGQDGNQGNGGQNGKQGKEGEQGLYNEEMSGELYEIYKRQQELRNQLEDMIEKEGLGSDAENLTKSMEQIEQELLEHGFTQETEQRMRNLKHQLLKLKDAVLQQGEDNKRESTTNTKTYKNTTKINLDKAKEYFNTTEILNRQSLPLRQNYKVIVQEYFKQNDD